MAFKCTPENGDDNTYTHHASNVRNSKLLPPTALIENTRGWCLISCDIIVSGNNAVSRACAKHSDSSDRIPAYKFVSFRPIRPQDELEIEKNTSSIRRRRYRWPPTRNALIRIAAVRPTATASIAARPALRWRICRTLIAVAATQPAKAKRTSRLWLT